MQTSVAALLLVTASVLFAVVVVNYTIGTFEHFLDTDSNPQIGQLKDLEDSLLNQTSSLYGQDTPQIPSEPTP